MFECGERTRGSTPNCSIASMRPSMSPAIIHGAHKRPVTPESGEAVVEFGRWSSLEGDDELEPGIVSPVGRFEVLTQSAEHRLGLLG